MCVCVCGQRVNLTTQQNKDPVEDNLLVKADSHMRCIIRDNANAFLYSLSSL